MSERVDVAGLRMAHALLADHYEVGCRHLENCDFHRQMETILEGLPALLDLAERADRDGLTDQQIDERIRRYHDNACGYQRQLAAAQARVARLEGALRELFALIEEGRLVRDTSADADTPTYMRQSVRLVKALAEAKAALTTEAP